MSLRDAGLVDEGALIRIDRELVAREGLSEFTKLAWSIVDPVDDLVWSWHHDAMCEHVEAVLRGDLRNLLINVPPGFTKSMIVSVMASAYTWTWRPGYRIIAISHKDSLARRDSRKVRGLVRSRWYRDRWPDVELVKLDEARLENGATGFRIIGSVQSGITGERGNLLLVDDPLTREKANSEAGRREASEFFWDTLPTRLTDFERDGKIVIMQRFHGADTSGEILDRAPDEWEKLVLPNEFEPGRRCVTSLGFSDPRTEEGELLHPERLGPEATAQMKGDGGIGAREYAGQFQQRPVPREGSIVKEEWLSHRFRERGAGPELVVQSWDCGEKTASKHDPSACLTAAVFPDRIEAWDYECRRSAFPELDRRARDAYEAYRPHFVLIEDASAGTQLIQVLGAETSIPVVPAGTDGVEKMLRLDTESGFIEAGKLWLPASAPWVSAFVAELTQVPAAPHDESADVVSQLLRWNRLRPRRPRGVRPASITKPSGRPV